MDNTGKSKLTSSKNVPAMEGGASTSGKSGPTGSKRTYPKDSKTNMSADFNPMKDKPSTYGLEGC